jgi:pimeloyl-ACP methyl ester carboxylesterase
VLEPSPAVAASSQWLVFLHPTNMDSRCWLVLTQLLPGHWRVLLDSRGHGASHQRGPFFIADYAADVRQVLNRLVPERAHLVGGSLGGSIACAVAGSLPAKVASIFAIGAALEPADAATLEHLDQVFRSPASLQEIFFSVMEREITHGLAPQMAAQALLQVGIAQRSRELIREITLNAFSEDATAYARNVTCPVAVLNGEHDESCPADAGRRMAGLLQGSFELLPAMGHLAMMQAPELIASRLTEFITEARS